MSFVVFGECVNSKDKHRNLFNRELFAPKILKTFAPVVGLSKSSPVQLIDRRNKGISQAQNESQGIDYSKLDRTRLIT